MKNIDVEKYRYYIVGLFVLILLGIFMLADHSVHPHDSEPEKGKAPHSETSLNTSNKSDDKQQRFITFSSSERIDRLTNILKINAFFETH